jgi:ATP-dependent DNA helicase RecG
VFPPIPIALKQEPCVQKFSTHFLPKIAPLAAKAVGGEMVRDAAFHLPVSLVDRRYRPLINEAEIGKLATIAATVESHEAGGMGRPYKVRMSDESGFLTILFFKPNTRYLLDRLPVGQMRIVSGEVGERYGERQIVHPSRIMDTDDPDLSVMFEPVYRSVAGLAHRTLARICSAAAGTAKGIPEWADAELIKRQGWSPFSDALAAVHAPADRVATIGCCKAANSGTLDLRRRSIHGSTFACFAVCADRCATPCF